jgi:hypothetical protein
VPDWQIRREYVTKMVFAAPVPATISASDLAALSLEGA